MIIREYSKMNKIRDRFCKWLGWIPYSWYSLTLRQRNDAEAHAKRCQARAQLFKKQATYWKREAQRLDAQNAALITMTPGIAEETEQLARQKLQEIRAKKSQ